MEFLWPDGFLAATGRLNIDHAAQQSRPFLNALIQKNGRIYWWNSVPEPQVHLDKVIVHVAHSFRMKCTCSTVWTGSENGGRPKRKAKTKARTALKLLLSFFYPVRCDAESDSGTARRLQLSTKVQSYTNGISGFLVAGLSWVHFQKSQMHFQVNLLWCDNGGEWEGSWRAFLEHSSTSFSITFWNAPDALWTDGQA